MLIAAIKQKNNDDHLSLDAELLSGIFEDLFPHHVCDKWKEFGEHFGVEEEELSRIKRQKEEEKAYPHGNLDDKNFFEVVIMLMSDADRFMFSKVNIYEALRVHHPEHAEKFKVEYYKTGPLYSNMYGYVSVWRFVSSKLLHSFYTETCNML